MTGEQAEEHPTALPGFVPGAHEVETLVAVIRRLSVATSVPEIMASVAPAARSLLGADGVTFVLREGDLCHYAEEDAIAPLWKGKRFPMDACISGWCMRQRRPVTISNIYEDQRIPHDAYRPTFVRSLAMVPVRKEDPVAAMGAYWAEEREVCSGEVELLQTLADSAALAIASAALRDREETEAELVRQESAHRIKNIFTIALALARLTEADSAEGYRDILFVRLRALEQAHAAISDASDATVRIAELLHRVLLAYTQSDRDRLHLEAADMRLPDSDAADLALILHELAANAIRHGAWSSPAGHVRVSCQPEGVGLRLVWQESGGPRVTPPAKVGLGTKLLRGIVSHRFGGEVRTKFAPPGFSCEIVLPLSRG